MKNLSIRHAWEGDRRLWEVWQKASTWDCDTYTDTNGNTVMEVSHATVYEMTENSVRVVTGNGTMRNTSESGWTKLVSFQPPFNAEGKYRLSFDASGYGEGFPLTMGVGIDAGDSFGDVPVTEVAGSGLYYLYYDVAAKYAGGHIRIVFTVDHKEGPIVLDDVLVEQVDGETVWTAGEAQGYQYLDMMPPWRDIDLGSGWMADARITEGTLTPSDASSTGIMVTLNEDVQDPIGLIPPCFPMTIAAGQKLLFSYKIANSSGGYSHNIGNSEGTNLEVLDTGDEILVINTSGADATVDGAFWWWSYDTNPLKADNWLTIRDFTWNEYNGGGEYPEVTCLAGGGTGWPVTFEQVVTNGCALGTVEFTYDGTSAWDDSNEGELSFCVLPEANDWDNAWSGGYVPVGAGYVKMTPRAGGAFSGNAVFTGLKPGATYVISVLSAYGSVYVKINKK